MVIVIVIMGVAGSGKTTVGSALAAARGWRFVDADDVHAPASVAKMARGEALTDADRAPWLARLRAIIVDALAQKTPLVLACSALKAAYREALVDGDGARASGSCTSPPRPRCCVNVWRRGPVTT